MPRGASPRVSRGEEAGSVPVHCTINRVEHHPDCIVYRNDCEARLRRTSTRFRRRAAISHGRLHADRN
ncbi:hypothetical protein THIOKS1700031 [Thiocapsa sp. KS1]|nr:hypothetical protein THIOKS1700031 [Thiocapsa sp. KS1]